MNKIQLAEKIATKINISKHQAESVLEAFVDVAIDELKNGGEVTLTGFGAFSARRRKGREGINPRNPQEKITIPSVVVAKFKAGKNLKEALKQSGQSASNSASSSASESELPTSDKAETDESRQ